MPEGVLNHHFLLLMKEGRKIQMEKQDGRENTMRRKGKWEKKRDMEKNGMKREERKE